MNGKCFILVEYFPFWGQCESLSITDSILTATSSFEWYSIRVPEEIHNLVLL
jgi:hypothetical protein